MLRTPDECFDGLVGFDFEPHYFVFADPQLGEVRLHYVDTGPPQAPAVLLLHGQPTWSYLYRHVISALAAQGHRVVAPDHLGFGRSDKPEAPTDHTFDGHITRLSALVQSLSLRQITLVAQDWGGPIGLAVLADDPDRFARVVATNTMLHTADPALAGRIGWANHSTGDGRMEVQEDLLDYVAYCQRSPVLQPSLFVRFATTTEVDAAALAGYDAPFPDPSYTAGVRQFPSLIPLTPNDPGAARNRRTVSALRNYERPFLTAFSDGDPASAGWDAVLRSWVPGAAAHDPVTMTGAGHFLQEDRGAELAAVIAGFIEATALATGS